MPLPKPKNKETKEDFISRCMRVQDDEFNLKDEKERKQALAICFSQYGRAKGTILAQMVEKLGCEDSLVREYIDTISDT